MRLASLILWARQYKIIDFKYKDYMYFECAPKRSKTNEIFLKTSQTNESRIF